MDSYKTDPDIGDKCSLNGDCSPLSDKFPTELNQTKNIDDIATPSELNFDQGMYNFY